MVTSLTQVSQLIKAEFILPEDGDAVIERIRNLITTDQLQTELHTSYGPGTVKKYII
jgi:hypothetical protein